MINQLHIIYSKSKIHLQNNTACLSSSTEDDDAEINELVRATNVNYQRQIYTPSPSSLIIK